MSLERGLAALELIALSLKRIADANDLSAKSIAAGLKANPIAVVSDETPAKVETKPRGRKPAAEAKTEEPVKPVAAPIPAAPKATPPAAAPPAAAPAATAELTDDTVNAEGFRYGDLKAAVIAMAAKGGPYKQHVIDTLAHFGVAKASLIPAELWGDAFNRINNPGGEEEEDFT